MAGGRAIGGAFDALVRAQRTELSGVDQLAERTARVWRDNGLCALMIDATTIQAAGREALAAKGDVGRWILPAFMSGLRELRPRPDVNSDDIRRLAEQLAALVVAEGPMASFQNWVWSEGAEGFDLAMDPSFVEVFDAQAVAPGTTSAIAGVRAAALAPIGSELVTLAADDLDVAALRPELEVEVDLYQRAAGGRGLEISGQTLRALGASCDEPGGWAIAELEAVLSHRPLRIAFPPDRLARRLAARAAQRCDAGLLGLLATMTANDDPYIARAVDHLVALDLGAQVGRGVTLAETTAAAALAGWLTAAAVPLVQPALRALLDRDDCRDDVVRVLGDLAGRLGHARWLELLEPATMDGAHAGVLAAVLVRTAPPPALIAQLLQMLAHEPAVRLACGLPARTLAVHGARLTSIAAGASVDGALDLFEHVATDDVAHALTARILAGRGQGWTLAQVSRLARIWLASGRAPAPLVLLVQARRVAGDIRLTLLRALAPRPELQAAAARRRATGFLDPAPLRRELRDVRRRRGP